MPPLVLQVLVTGITMAGHNAVQTRGASMSKSTIHALMVGEITPAQFWIRHIESWTLIADVTPIQEVEDVYRDLADVAADLADDFAKVA